MKNSASFGTQKAIKRLTFLLLNHINTNIQYSQSLYEKLAAYVALHNMRGGPHIIQSYNGT